MKAATLHAFGSPLSIGPVPDPVPGTGEVIVDVVATGILPYAAEVFSGARNYPLRLPVAPGCGAIGRVRATGPDATRLHAGSWVFCDPTVRSRDGGIMPDITLQGWNSRGEGGLRLQEFFHDGPFAERMRMPTENAIPLGPIDEAHAGRWCAMGLALVPYGGLLAAGFGAGEMLLVSGATGNYGSAAVATGLAMGAACVVAPGRNEGALADLRRRFGPRVRTVALTGDADGDRNRMQDAASGPIDCVLDILPPAVGAAVVRTALMTVRPYGRVVLMGGVGMLGGDDLALPYPWIMRNCVTIHGQWMYPPSAVRRPSDGRTGPCRAAGPWPILRDGVPPGRRERGRRARRRPCRAVPHHRAPALTTAGRPGACSASPGARREAPTHMGVSGWRRRSSMA